MSLWLLQALLAGLAVAVTAGPLGTFVVWRRMAYFGDTLAHSALLGIGFSLLLGIHPVLSIAAAGVLLAMALVLLQYRQTVATDTLLGILAHTSLALGLVLLSLLDNPRIDLMAYLFGDLLAIGPADLALMLPGCAVVLILLVGSWRALLMITVHEDLARVEGLPVTALKLLLMVLIALVVALAMKLVGILLITALLVIPAASARRLAGSPEAMAWLAAGIGSLAVGLGLLVSVRLDSPAGPTIVSIAGLIYLCSLLYRRGALH